LETDFVMFNEGRNAGGFELRLRFNFIARTRIELVF
jgi:hypothetical protein